jgi:hypothetical protein
MGTSTTDHATRSDAVLRVCDGGICPRRFLVAGQTDSTDRHSDALVPELGTFDPAWPGRLLPMVMRSERQESVVWELFGDLVNAGRIRQGKVTG